MIIVSVILISAIFCCFDVFFISKIKEKTKIAQTVIADISGINVITVFLVIVILKMTDKPQLFETRINDMFVASLYFLTAFVAGLVILFFKAMADGKLYVKKNATADKKFIRTNIVSAVMLFLGMAALTGTAWGIETTGKIGADQMIVNLFSPRDGTSSDVIETVLTGPVYITFSVLIIFCIFAFSPREVYVRSQNADRCVFSLRIKKILCLILAFVVLLSGIFYGITQFELTKVFRMYFVESDFIEDNYVDPRDVKFQFPEKKRNLVHIYLESMENTYMSEDLGGYMEENLIKPLSDLSAEGVNFSHREKGLGGPIATTGTTWSVAAMVNINTGLPMKVPVSKKNYREKGEFLPGAVALGDILASMDYEQTLMFGASSKFGGLNHFYKDHGDFNILDHDGVKKKGWIDKDYNVWWGYEDDKLFEFAKTELTRLAETGKPFNFVMETADTHFPDGYVGKKTPTPRESQYANVIAYSASETVEFIRWIQAQPFYENTTVVIIGDHLSMDGKFFKGFDRSYKRTTFNLILNPADGLDSVPQETRQNRCWSNFDMFPTILASIGVRIEGEKLGLGTNLFSGEKTLFEENGGIEGINTVASLLEKKSVFYDNKFLRGTLNPFDTKNVTYY